MTFKRGDVVKVGSTLATVIHDRKCGGASGWAVLEWRNPMGYGTDPYDYTAFAAEGMAQLAELDVSVCRSRRWSCSCPLLHIDHPEWLETKKTPTEVGV